MKKYILILLTILSLSVIFYFPVSADTYEELTYIKSWDGITITGCSENSTNIIIPSMIDGLPVTTVGTRAFANTRKLNSVIISDGVIKLDYQSFENSSVKSVSLPDTIQTIGGYVFNNCNYLSEINLPSELQNIGYSAFSNCSRLTSINIPNGITEIRDNCFSGCSSLSNIDIPLSVTSIGISAFSDCAGLTSVTVPDTVTFLGDFTFSGCTGLISASLPEGITEINGTFSGCTSLTDFIIPKTNQYFRSI